MWNCAGTRVEVRGHLLGINSLHRGFYKLNFINCLFTEPSCRLAECFTSVKVGGEGLHLCLDDGEYLTSTDF